MKCPKCKYNTFEFLDSCKKCGADLRAFKESLGVRPMVLPRRESPPVVATAPPLTADAAKFTEARETGDGAEEFSWETPVASPPHPETAGIGLAAPVEAVEESFNFDTSEDLSFGDLPDFTTNTVEAHPTPSLSAGEFALEDFFQEEAITDSPAQTGAPSSTEPGSFPPGEFDFLLENDPPDNAEHRRG